MGPGTGLEPPKLELPVFLRRAGGGEAHWRSNLRLGVKLARLASRPQPQGLRLPAHWPAQILCQRRGWLSCVLPLGPDVASPPICRCLWVPVSCNSILSGESPLLFFARVRRDTQAGTAWRVAARRCCGHCNLKVPKEALGRLGARGIAGGHARALAVACHWQ